MAASRVAQLEGVEGALASIFEGRGAFLRVLGPWPLLALVVCGYGIYSAIVTVENLPKAAGDAVAAELIVAHAYGPLFVLGITVSFPTALLVGRSLYRRRVRPLLAARPPRWPGAPMRCRGCGADLRPSREAFSPCPYCRTQNLVGEGAGADHARRLEEEAAAYRARASGLVAHASSTSVHMSRTLVVCLVLVYAGVIGFGVVAGALIRALT
jgi:hypothetical protein